MTDTEKLQLINSIVCDVIEFGRDSGDYQRAIIDTIGSIVAFESNSEEA